MRVLGILNVTPDSFSDGGRFQELDRAVVGAHAMVESGADAIDIGGESTRPGSQAVSVEEERRRVLPVLEAIGPDFPVPISIDTRRAEVARAAADRGASIINDTAALRDDPELAGVVAERDLTVVLMHRRGTPETMQVDPHYEDVIAEVRTFFEGRVAAAREAGIAAERIVLDPGLGFGKRPADNYRLLDELDAVRVEGLPVLIGASRKSFLGRFDERPFEDRLPGSLAFAAASRARGAEWIRVHDVAETVAFLRTLDAIDDPRRVEPTEQGARA